MKKRGQKLLSLVLSLVMLLSLFPTAMAEEGNAYDDAEAEEGAIILEELPWGDELVMEEPEGEATEQPEEPALREEEPAEQPGEAAGTEAQPEEGPAQQEEAAGTGAQQETVQTEEPGAGPAPAEEPAPADETLDEIVDEEETAAAEIPTEGEQPADTVTADEDEKTEDPDADKDEKEEKPLPYGFRGLPEGYTLSEQELAAKRVLTEQGVLEALLSGGEYVEGEVIFSADSEEYARMLAEAYSAELADFTGTMGKLRLSDATVEEAVRCAADMDCPLPAVAPNWIVHLEPETESEGVSPDAETQAAYSGLRWQDWISWMRRSGKTPDPYMSDPAGHYQYHHDLVHSYGAWGVTTGSQEIVVAVVDSGVDYNHEDLSGRVIRGKDFVDGDFYPYDENSHGTHVAGIIGAAMGNGVGGSGIAPKVRILAVRVLDSGGTGSDYAIASGIDYAWMNGASIINISITGPGFSQQVQDAIQRAYENGVTVIAAMGNQGSNIKQFPAAYSHVIAVGATDISGKRSHYSNYGSWCDVSAPGSAILSTMPGGYGYKDGTSMAAPVVSGVAALYMSLRGNPGADQMEKLLKKAVSGDAGTGMGKGIIDAAKLFGVTKGGSYPNVYTANGTPVTDGRVGSDGYLTLASADGLTTAASRFLFSTDGENPSVQDGEIVHGAEVTQLGAFDEERGCFVLPLSSFMPGEAVTFRFVELNEYGLAGDVTETKLMIQEPETVPAEPEAAPTEAEEPKETPKEAEEETDAPGIPEELQEGNTGEISAISISGPAIVGRGTSVTYKASVTTSKAKNKKVRWRVRSSADEKPPAGVSIDKNTGKVTVKKSVAVGTVFYVGAEPADGSGSAWSGWLRVRVDEKASAVSLSTGKKVTLAMVDIPSTDGADNQFTVQASRKGASYAGGISWKSSKPSVAAITWDNGNGTVTVTAYKTGTAVLTAKATDGSGKSATVTVKVTVPASSITVVSKSKDLNHTGWGEGKIPIGYGTTVGNKAILGTTYGTPSVKKVKWSYAACLQNYDGSYSYNEGLTGFIKENKFAKLSSSGSLTLSSKAESVLGGYNYTILVYAQTTDGTELVDGLMYFPLVRIRKIGIYFNGSKVKSFSLDTSQEWKIPLSIVGNDGYAYNPVYTASSSNPNIVGAYVEGTTLYVVRNATGKTGTAKITVKATDGSNKTASVTVKVTKPKK